MLLSKFKHLLYIPTIIIKFLFVASIVALLIDVYLFFNIDASESISVGPIAYLKGSEGYVQAVKEMKIAITLSTFVSILVALVSFRVITKRKREMNKQQ